MISGIRFRHERERLRVSLAQPTPAIEHENNDVGDADCGQRLADDSLGPFVHARRAPGRHYRSHDKFAIAVLRTREI